MITSIDQVNCLARQEKMPKGLKILTHDNTTLYKLTLIVGVGNHDQDQEEDNSKGSIENINVNK